MNYASPIIASTLNSENIPLYNHQPILFRNEMICSA